MELSAVGERVFAAESIIKRRIRKVRGAAGPARGGWEGRTSPHRHHYPPPTPPRLRSHPRVSSVCFTGPHRVPVKWKGWAIK